MKTQVEFRSSKFPPYDGEEEEINPGLWGKRLAEYLVRKLSEKGIKTEGIVGEDWGYYIPVENDGFKLAVCCGHQNGDDDEFLCFTDPSPRLHSARGGAHPVHGRVFRMLHPLDRSGAQQAAWSGRGAAESGRPGGARG
jgi:hypothetical protein